VDEPIQFDMSGHGAAGTRRFVCMLCMHVYDEAEGDPDSGIAPGTLWENLPDDWRCPRCGASKAFFENEIMFSQRRDLPGDAPEETPPGDAPGPGASEP
jgi:rubredoxin